VLVAGQSDAEIVTGDTSAREVTRFRPCRAKSHLIQRLGRWLRKRYARLVTKLWNVSQFCHQFLNDYEPPSDPPALSSADRWILSKCHRLIQRATRLLEEYDYGIVKTEVEAFFWHDLADNYLEMVKMRLYEGSGEVRDGARFVLYHVLLSVIKLFAPFLPFVTERIYWDVFNQSDTSKSLHQSSWPQANSQWISDLADRVGDELIEIITAVRRFKNENNLKMAEKLKVLQIVHRDGEIQERLRQAQLDLMGVTRAAQVDFSDHVSEDLQILGGNDRMVIAVAQS